MNAIRNEIHNKDNISYNYDIPLMIPISGCILKRNKIAKYKNSIYYIFFKLNSHLIPYITTKEYNTGKIYTNHIMKISCFLEKKS